MGTKVENQAPMRAGPLRAGGLYGALILALVLAAPGVHAQTSERPSVIQASDFIAELVSKAAIVLAQPGQTLAQREAGLRALLRRSFEIPLIARIALGKHWRKVSDGDRAAYTEIFGDFLLRTYGSKLGAFERDKFQIADAVPRGKRDMVVETRILHGRGNPIKAGWRVRLVKGEPKIIDILIEGVSMALTQRQEFASVLSKDGLGGLMEMLRARAQRLPVEGPREARAS